MEKKANLNGDVQRNAFNLTINNPIDHGYDHNSIKGKVITDFTTIRFVAMSDEIGEQGTPHTHVYLNFSSRVRFSKIKKAFPEAHIEVAKGSVEANVNYLKKEGKWADTKKAETSVEGSYEEWGTRPTQKGTKQELEELYEMIKNGYSNAEILAVNNDYIRDIDKLDKVRTIILQERFKNQRRMDLRVIYISGHTGTGKTRGILDTHGDANVYRVSDYEHPFDGYSIQEVIAFDEYRSQIRLSDMLQYCDIYPIELPARYNNKFACFKTVYIVSNWALEKQYANCQNEDLESWKAFLRRIHEVRIYNEDGTIDHYNSVQEYLKREEKFHYATRTEQSVF